MDHAARCGVNPFLSPRFRRPKNTAPRITLDNRKGPYYDPGVEREGLISLHRQHVDRFLASAIPSTPGVRGLHLGSGPGPRGRYRPSPEQTWIDCDLTCGDVRGDALALPFRASSFSVVRASEFLYSIDARYLVRAIGEMRRVLTLGGRLVITAPLLVPPIADYDLTRLTPNGWRRILPFHTVTITPLGGFYSHLVITLEHLSSIFAVLRPLARFDDGTYPHALGIVCE